MTVARIWQFHAEQQSVADVILESGSAYPTISSTKAFTGSYSYRTATANSPGRTFTGVTGVRLGYYVNHVGIGTSGTGPVLAAFRVGSSAVYIIWDRVSNKFSIYLGYQYNSASRNIAASNIALTGFDAQDAWHHVGVNYYCHSSAGYLSLYINGTLAHTISGDTTVYAASKTAKEAASIDGAYGPGIGIGASGAWGSYCYLDDFYIDEYSGGEADVAPTSRRFLPSLVTADSGTPGWTPTGAANNYACVDEAVPNGNTDYVLATSANLIDYYATGDITVPTGFAVRAAIVQAYCYRTDTGTNSQLRTKIKNGTDIISSADLTPGGSYGYVFGRHETAPDGSAWSQTEFNDSVFGIESRGTF